MLELRDITLSREGFHLRADFKVRPKTRVALIGPSGAGKTSLLSVIAGFEDAHRGAVLWDGNDITRMLPGQRPISIIFQDNNLFPHLSVRANVGLGIDSSGRLSDLQRSKVEDVLGLVGLGGFGDRKPAELSGGQQGRVALARTLVRERPLVLLDEPFSALGPALKAEMLDLVAEVTTAKGMTVVMVSHDPGDARRFAEVTVFMDEGQAHQPEPTDRIFAHPTEALKRYLGE